MCLPRPQGREVCLRELCFSLECSPPHWGRLLSGKSTEWSFLYTALTPPGYGLSCRPWLTSRAWSGHLIAFWGNSQILPAIRPILIGRWAYAQIVVRPTSIGVLRTQFNLV